MLFWILAAILTAGVVIVVVRPLMRPADAIDRSEFDLAVYRDQLAEIDRDVERGLIGEVEAEAARTEIGRRVLSADKQGQRPAGRRPGGRLSVLALAAFVPAAALVAYVLTGSPELPSQPFAQRDMAPVEAFAAELAAADAMAEQLQRQPDNIDGWVELGARYAALERWGEAAAAYARAIGRIGGVDPAVTGAWAEATVNANEGTVTEEARLGFEQTLAARPGDPRARYYLALATAQRGDAEDALRQWSDLAIDTPPGASWAAALRLRIEQTAAAAGIDPQPYLVGPAMLGPEGLAAIDDMTEDQQAAMIEGMVAGLAARLEAAPDDVDGWLRLASAYRVLGRQGAADAALGRAIEYAPDDAAILSQIADRLLTGWGGGPLPDGLEPVLVRLVVLSPDDPAALLFLGEAAARRDDVQAARDHWTRLRSLLEPGSAEHDAINVRLEDLPPP